MDANVDTYRILLARLMFLGPSQYELNISPDTILGINLFAPSDRHL